VKATLFISLGWFLLSGWAAAAEPSYLLLKLTESSMDNARRRRHGVTFLEMNGTNRCGVLLHLGGGKDKRTFEAIMEEALEKGGTRDTNGLLRRKATRETIFFVPGASIQSILRFAYPDFYLATDFSGWRLASPSRAEIEKSETLQRLLEARTQTQAEIEAYFRRNGLTNSAALRVGIKLEDAIKILGEPTHHIHNGRMIEGKPAPSFDGWLRWYHNPGDRLHVAPTIRLRIENGIVKELEAGRA
jgi:hypothetical protein